MNQKQSEVRLELIANTVGSWGEEYFVVRCIDINNQTCDVRIEFSDNDQMSCYFLDSPDSLHQTYNLDLMARVLKGINDTYIADENDRFELFPDVFYDEDGNDVTLVV